MVLPTAVSHINQALGQGGRAYVHCTAGLGRAPAACIAFLYWYHEMQLPEVGHIIAARFSPLSGCDYCRHFCCCCFFFLLSPSLSVHGHAHDSSLSAYVHASIHVCVGGNITCAAQLCMHVTLLELGVMKRRTGHLAFIIGLC